MSGKNSGRRGAFRAIAWAVAGVIGPVAGAAVVSDPARVTGANAIDPAGGQTVDTDGSGTGFASQAVLKADPTFGALQSFTGFAAGSNTVNYADSSLPDILFTLTGKFTPGTSGAPSGAGFTSTGVTTSPNDGLRLRVSDTTTVGSGGTLVYTIDFGDNSSGSFVSNANPVDKAGFTVSNLRSGNSLLVEFLSGSGAILSSQTATGSDTDPNAGDSAGLDAYFGYDSDGTLANAISAVRISLTASDAMANQSGLLDDLGFSAVVPEPGVCGLVAMGGLALMGRRVRRRG